MREGGREGGRDGGRKCVRANKGMEGGSVCMRVEKGNEGVCACTWRGVETKAYTYIVVLYFEIADTVLLVT